MTKRALSALLFLCAGAGAVQAAASVADEVGDSCWKYTVSDVIEKGARIEAKLDLAGEECGHYGTDVAHLKLFVEYQDGGLHSRSGSQLTVMTDY